MMELPAIYWIMEQKPIYDIIPGDAAHSILAYRMNSTESGIAMPELARTVIHKEGVKLIADWINQIPVKKKY